MWRGWQEDLKAALVGLTLLVVLFYVFGGAVMTFKAVTCDAECEEQGGWRLYPSM